MAAKLNQRAFEHAKKLIEDGQFVHDERDLWSEHQPTTEQENEFIAAHGFGEYAKWHLGIDDGEPEGTKGRYKFPMGTFARCIGAASCPLKSGLDSITTRI